jgi:hypothetical protein
MSTYKLIGGHILEKDGAMTVCPIANAIPYPKKASSQPRLTDISGGAQMEFELKRFPCTTKCPHFRILGGDDALKDKQGNIHKHFKLTCVPSPVVCDLIVESKS